MTKSNNNKQSLSLGIRYIIAVLRDRFLWGWALCLDCNKEDYYY